MLIQVTLSKNLFTPLTYRYTGDIDLKIGSRVIVPLRNRLTTGWVLSVNHKYEGRVKKVLGVIKDTYNLDKSYLNFAKDISERYICSLGIILDLSLPPKRKGFNGLYTNIDGHQVTFKNLSPDKIKTLSLKKPLTLFYKNQIDPPDNKIIINQKNPPGECHKTYFISQNREEYFSRIIEANLGQKKNVLLLTSDNISANYLNSVFKKGILYTSDLSPKQREKIWEELYYADNQLIIGGLSAAFLPITNIGAIIFERATFFKSICNPYIEFNIDEVAKVRASIYHVNYHEGGGCQTMETFINAHKKELIIEQVKNTPTENIEVRRLHHQNKKIPEDFIITIRNLVAKKKEF